MLACAHGPGLNRSEPSQDPVAEPSRPSAARMYQTAEALADAGYYADAVRLMRHAILSLPRTGANDELRHALVLRMAHVQLLAAHHEDNSAYALDAATMLGAYGQRHYELFGDGRTSQRNDIYELLYEAESLSERIDAPEPAARPAPLAHRAQVAQAAIDTHEGEDLEAEIKREVRVQRQWFYDPDDPQVRKQLESWFSDAGGYDDMTSPGVAVLSGPRPMVRRTGSVSSVALQGVAEPEHRALRVLSRRLLQASRDALRGCYQAAAARGGELQTDATIELTITSTGAVEDVVVVGGDVVDGLGDACVIEQLDAAKLAQDAPTAAVRMRVSFLFFYDGPDTMLENNPHHDLVDVWGPRGVSNPNIDDFAEPPN